MGKIQYLRLGAITGGHAIPRLDIGTMLFDLRDRFACINTGFSYSYSTDKCKRFIGQTHSVLTWAKMLNRQCDIGIEDAIFKLYTTDLFERIKS